MRRPRPWCHGAMVPWCRGARLDLHNWVLGWLLQSPAGHPPNTSAPQQRPGAGAKNHCTMAWCQCCSPRPYPGALSAHLERTPAWPRGCEAWSWYLLLRCIEYMQPLEVVWIHTKICNRTDWLTVSVFLALWKATPSVSLNLLRVKQGFAVWILEKYLEVWSVSVIVTAQSQSHAVESSTLQPNKKKRTLVQAYCESCVCDSKWIKQFHFQKALAISTLYQNPEYHWIPWSPRIGRGFDQPGCHAWQAPVHVEVNHLKSKDDSDDSTEIVNFARAATKITKQANVSNENIFYGRLLRRTYCAVWHGIHLPVSFQTQKHLFQQIQTTWDVSLSCYRLPDDTALPRPPVSGLWSAAHTSWELGLLGEKWCSFGSIVKCLNNVLWASAKGVPWQCQSVLMSNCGSRCTLTEASFETSTSTFASVIRLMSFHSVFKSQSSQSSGFRNVYTYAYVASLFCCLHECKIVQVWSMHCIRSLTWDCEDLVPIIGPHLALPSPRCHLVESFVLKMATCHFSVMCSAYTTCCLINIYIYIIY